MRKALKFKRWLTLHDAAQNLSLLLDDDVQIPDILQLAVDLELKLSVNFLRTVNVIKVSLIPMHEEIPPFEYHATEYLVDKAQNPPYQFRFYDDSEVEVFDGVCNIVMMFGGLYTVKQAIYSHSKELVEIKNPIRNILLEKNGEFYLLLNQTDQVGPTIKMEAEGIEYLVPVIKRKFQGLDIDMNFILASYLPPNTEFVVTKNALEEFEFNYSQPDLSADDKPFNARLENNYLRLIKELTLLIKGVNLKVPYQAAQLIIDSTEIKISQDTISKYLMKANKLESRERE